MVRKSIMLMSAAIIFVLVSLAFAQEDKKETTPTAPAVKGKQVTLEGTLVCLGCDLKANEGARSACSVYGHTHALKTKDGKYITLLPNQYSADLLKGEKYHNKPVKLSGVLHTSANQLDVETFEVEGQNMTWCTEHNAMDACASAGASKK